MSVPCHPSVPAYQLRIQLRGISPPVWRRVLIPMASTIQDLHEAIQATFGWEDTHLNRFTIRGQHYGVAEVGGMRFSAQPDRLQLIDFDFCEHDRFVYEYDFYSRWTHDIRVEKRLVSASVPLPTCIAGGGACPLEDSGPAGYYMQQLDEHSVVGTLVWLQESLEDGIPMGELREEFIERARWADNRFDRHEANARLRSSV